MDKCFIVQCVGKCEEVIGVEEVVAFEVVDDLGDEAFSGAGVQSRRCHDKGIGSNPGGRSVYDQLCDIDRILSEALTVLYQGHRLTVFG